MFLFGVDLIRFEVKIFEFLARLSSCYGEIRSFFRIFEIGKVVLDFRFKVGISVEGEFLSVLVNVI